MLAQKKINDFYQALGVPQRRFDHDRADHLLVPADGRPTAIGGRVNRQDVHPENITATPLRADAPRLRAKRVAPVRPDRPNAFPRIGAQALSSLLMEARDLLLSADLAPESARVFLAALGFQNPAEADRRLQRLADLTGERERFANLAASLLDHLASAADPDAAMVQLERFFEAVPNRLNLTSFLTEDVGALELLIQVLGASPFLSEVLLRNPEYLYWLTTGRLVDKAVGADYFEREASAALGFEKAGTGLDYLRRLRRRENLRIAAQDLLGKIRFASIVSQISGLAEAILQTSFQLLWPNPQSGGFAVMALGKLGGGELNFSSDIDLLYVYADDRDPAAMVRFARSYTRALGEFTGEGSLYRIDLRLRPMGRTGEIAYSLGAYRHYYETGADTFDRLALLKCRWVAGDATLGRAFVESLGDFVFRKYLDHAAVEEIRWLKRRTDRRLDRRGESGRNVKLGLGGIREIEFFVQSFQILYGGTRPEIRSGATLEALDRLADAGLISQFDYGELRQAYVFFRNLEHRLQLVHDQQTQTLPTDPDELERVARRMGFGGRNARGREAFLHEFELRSGAVHKIFSSLFSDADSGGVRDLALNPALDPEEAHRLLAAQDIQDPEGVQRVLAEIQSAPAFPHSPTRMRNLFANLLPLLLEQCRLTPKPASFLSRFDRLAEAVGARASLYRGLMENPGFAQRLFSTLITGDFLSETLIRHPELLDSVSAPATIAAAPTAARLQEDWSAFGDRRSSFPLALRRYKRREEFKIAVLDLNAASESGARARLSELADICLRACCGFILEDYPDLQQQSFVLCALGKLGGQELTYHSDLDLVLFYDDRPGTPATRFNDFARDLKRTMEEYTEEGQVYKVDFRLRPEGRHSGLATPLSAFAAYVKERMESWERLAYVKLRPIHGHGPAKPPIDALPRQPFSSQEVEGLKLLRGRKEIEIGREKQSAYFDFKVGRGGLMDIQFIVQKL